MWQGYPVHFRVWSDPMIFILYQLMSFGMGQVGVSLEQLTAIFYRGGSPPPCGTEKKEYPSLSSELRSDVETPPCRFWVRMSALPPWPIPPVAGQKLQLIVVFSLQFHHETAGLDTFSYRFVSSCLWPPRNFHLPCDFPIQALSPFPPWRLPQA